MSSTSPSWSTARQRYCSLPFIVRNTSSRCHRSPSRPRRERIRLVYIPPEFQTPLADALIADCDATLGHHFFDVSVAECKSKIKPSAMTDNYGRKAVAPIGWRVDGQHVHANIATCSADGRQVDNTSVIAPPAIPPLCPPRRYCDLGLPIRKPLTVGASNQLRPPAQAPSRLDCLVMLARRLGI
jgi:hypothetical protein